MGKNPAFQFYPGDWFREPGLRASSIAAKGAWAQILFSMHDAKERGKLSGSLEYWGRLIGVDPWGEYEQHGSHSTCPWDLDTDTNTDTALSLIRELHHNEVCDVEFLDEKSHDVFFNVGDFAKNFPSVTARDIFVTVINRRMYREYRELQRKANNTRNYRLRKSIPEQVEDGNQNITNVCDQTVTILSSSSSSSSPTKKKKKIHTPPYGGNGDFDLFWKAYPKKKAPGRAKKAWKWKNPPIDVVLSAIETQKDSEEWKKEGGQYIPYPATWINGECWKDEVIIVSLDDKYKKLQDEFDKAEALRKEKGHD